MGDDAPEEFRVRHPLSFVRLIVIMIIIIHLDLISSFFSSLLSPLAPLRLMGPRVSQAKINADTGYLSFYLFVIFIHDISILRYFFFKFHFLI